MANNIWASFPEIWAKEQQAVFMKKNVAMEIADMSFQGSMARGDVLHRTYPSVSASTIPSIYTRDTDVTFRDITDTDETLTVNRQFIIPFYLDDFDSIQNNYDAAAMYGRNFGIALQSQVDADVLGEVLNAWSVVDAGDVWGTTGQGISLTTSNVLQTITTCTKKLNKLNVYSNDRVGIVSPDFEDVVSQYYGAKVTDLGDDVAQNWYFRSISGYKLFSSNNLTATAVLAMATNPTANDTITIAWQVFTFVSSIGTTAGNVLIGANVDITRANLETLINAPQTTTATGVALTGDNLIKFRARISAVNNNTADTITITAKGESKLSVAETLTAGADVWTTALQKQHCVFGIAKSCTTLVMQKKPSVEVKDNPNRLGKNILNGVLYWVKTFADNAKNMVRVELNASGY